MNSEKTKVLFALSQAMKSKHVNLYIAGMGDPQADYQLDVDVSGLIFSHHPLFSREHVLAARLAQLYDQHLTRQHKNLTRLLTDKVTQSSNNKTKLPVLNFLFFRLILNVCVVEQLEEHDS